MKEVSENILSFAPVKVDVSKIILHDAIMDSIRLLEKESKIIGRKLEVHCLIPLYLNVSIGKGHLHEVISNLIRNSMESMPEGSTCIINIEGKEEDRYVKLRIKDNGPCIPDSIKDKVFRPFFSTKKGGTGLGLVISKRIIESYGGEIYIVDSNKGTTFEIIFPSKGDV